MIKNLIFDWGNVLIDVSVERFAKSCKAFGIQFADDEVGSAHKAGFFLEYEKGNLSDCEFRNEIRFGLEWNVGQDSCREIATPVYAEGYIQFISFEQY